MSNRQAIVAAVRTPIGKAGRAYADVHPVDLLAVVLDEVVRRAGVEPERVDEVVVGCTQQGGDQSINVARNGWLAAGLPVSAAATTVDTQCGSSQQAVGIACGLIASGQAEVVVAGGVESLTRVPAFAPMESMGGQAYSPRQLAFYDMPHQGEAGERMAEKYGISRDRSDAFGLRSHLRAHQGWESGAFDDEIVFVERDGQPLLVRDEGIRADSSMERLAALTPVYREDGVITAGSASQLSDGSAALLLASEDACRTLGLEPLAWVRRSVAVGVDPELMMEGPIVATRALLDRERLSLDDIGHFELHEAYATVVCAWHDAFGVDDERLNPHGGAIALGHPFGASGARQLAHLVHSMRRSGTRLGLQAMCCGGGIGTGSLIELA